MQSKQERIRQIDLFAGCRTDAIRWIGQHADEIDVRAGTTLVSAGTKVRQFIVVLEGVAVTDDGVAYGPCAHFGDVGIIGDEPHPDTITALTDMVLLVFETRSFSGLLDRVPAVSRRLMRELIVQMRDGDEGKPLETVAAA
jgi:CRP-like cAMP-binding protein